MTNVKKKRVSKKAPKSWRKHVDQGCWMNWIVDQGCWIKDVEDFLEDQSFQERIGTNVEKRDDELFTVDTKPDEKLLLTAKERRTLNKSRPLKSQMGLINQSKVKDPRGKRDGLRVKPKINADIKAAKGIISKKVIRAIDQRKKTKEEKEKNKKAQKSKAIFKNDLWEEEEKPIPEELKNDAFSSELVTHTMMNTGILTVRAPRQMRVKLKQMASIELPHPGISYNPTLEDHQNLLQHVTAKEEKIIKHEQHLDRVTTAKFSKTTADQRDAADLAEMAVGINTGEVKSEDDSDSETGEYKTINAPVKNKKKDRKARRKQREQKTIKLQLSLAKVEKKKVTDLHRLRFLKKNVEKLEVEDKTLLKQRKLRQKQRKFETSQIGPLKYVAPEDDVQMPENMSGNLRNLVPEGKLINDRFKSLQKRNIIPMSKHAGLKKKVKVKRYTKSSHKEKQLPLERKKAVVKSET